VSQNSEHFIGEMKDCEPKSKITNWCDRYKFY